MGRFVDNIKNGFRSVGRVLNVENLRKGIGYGQKALDISRLIQNSNTKLGNSLKKVPVDNIQTALDIGKKVEHIASGRPVPSLDYSVPDGTGRTTLPPELSDEARAEMIARGMKFRR